MWSKKPKQITKLFCIAYRKSTNSRVKVNIDSTSELDDGHKARCWRKVQIEFGNGWIMEEWGKCPEKFPRK